MQPWADRLERRVGFIAIPGLAAFLTGMNALAGLLSLFKPEFPSQLSLDPARIWAGQFWRLATYVFIPPQMSPLWLLFWLILFYAFLRRLELVWGDFRFTLYCLLGVLGTAAASLFLGVELSNAVFAKSMFLAFARVDPDFEILLLFFFPVKMRWVAAVLWALTLLEFLAGGFDTRMALAFGLVNYWTFFGPGHRADFARAWRARSRS